MSDDGQQIVSDRGKWRLVRGAIQEVYRVLNQRDENLGFPSDLKPATRVRKA